MAVEHVSAHDHRFTAMTCAEVAACRICHGPLPAIGGCTCEGARKVRMAIDATSEQVDHPAHYGGADDPYEAIKVIEAWGLGFCLGNAVKYIARAERKGAPLTDLQKARWYIDREIARRGGA